MPSQTHCVKHQEVLHRFEEERNIVHETRGAKYCNVTCRRVRTTIVAVEKQ